MAMEPGISTGILVLVRCGDTILEIMFFVGNILAVQKVGNQLMIGLCLEF